MTQRFDTVWQDESVAKRYLNGLRGAIPGAGLQLEVLLQLQKLVKPPVKRFLDLGCGDGVLGQVLLDAAPNAQGVFLDFSPAMMDAARRRLAPYAGQCFVNADYGDPAWVETVAERTPFDMIVSGFSIHHQTDERKQGVYGEILELLRPGGLFVNLEHVEPKSPQARWLFDEHFIDTLYALEQSQDGPRTREQLAHEFLNREDPQANILSPTERQLDWLREIGFVDVDCHFKLYELAIFAGFRPDAN